MLNWNSVPVHSAFARVKELNTLNRVKVWDIPTRLVHWLLVAFLGFSWWTAKTHHMDWHRYSGYALLGIVLFRIYWGLAGSSTARFSGFVKGPGTMLRYLRGEHRHAIGHNPLGAWSVIALLLLVFVQVGLGLFAVDVDGIESGPLTYLVSFETGRVLAERHAQVFVLLQIFVTVHVLAVISYLVFKRSNLIGPMVTGSTKIETVDSVSIIEAKLAPWWSALIGVLIASAIVWYIASR